MLALLPRVGRRPLNVLCVGAHCDDVPIGCGGSLLALQKSVAQLRIDWLVLSADARRRREEARAFAAFVSPKSRGGLKLGGFPDGRFPTQYGPIKEFFEAAKKDLPAPDVILCHERDDRHQDHRLINEMMWNTFRDHLILEYEIPKWDGGLGQPNLYVPLSRVQAQRKAKALLRVYPSQGGRDWFTEETFLSLLRLRGIECRAPGGYAEAFHGRKVILG